MVFNPRTDVILEVLNAADPSRASAAAQRLSSLAASSGAGADFSADLNRAAEPMTASPALDANATAARAIPQAPAGSERLNKAKTQFEAMMLEPLIGEMFPKDATQVFGQGTAGDMWKTMLAEQVSMQVARSGALGLAKRLLATHEFAPHGGGLRQGETKLGTDAAQMSENVLSAPASADFDNGAILFAGRRRL
jgi:Rod binding domain-containing protein